MEYFSNYRPLTATPFIHNLYHAEYEPCAELKPYICCFWGSKQPYDQNARKLTHGELVVPDTCMDLIFTYNYTTNQANTGFSGISNTSFQTGIPSDPHRYISSFGIRFYAWTAILFSDESMQNVKNAFGDADIYFPKLKAELEGLFFDCTDISQRIAITQECLLRHLHSNRENRAVNDSLAVILQARGNIDISTVGHQIAISTRQLERLYQTYLGLTPKQFTSLIRYQSLWQDMIHQPAFNILDAVAAYGYADQSHLLKDFKRYHTMLPGQAVQFARKNVAFLQDNIRINE